MSEDPTEEAPPEIRPGRLACPVCSATMQIQTKKGISIDACPEHGIWLDTGELDTITMKLTRKLMRHSQARVRGARREGAISGAVFGWWALLGD